MRFKVCATESLKLKRSRLIDIRLDVSPGDEGWIIGRPLAPIVFCRSDRLSKKAHRKQSPPCEGFLPNLWGLHDNPFSRIENSTGQAGRHSEPGRVVFVEAVICKFLSGAP
jgi:hypothetical protein